jgi:small subunit ribosomal protein S20
MDRRDSAPSQVLSQKTASKFYKGVNDLPNIKSAKKRVKVTASKTMQNKMLKTALKTSMKKYEAALASGDKAAAAETYKAAVKKIDQAVAKGILHKNNAARKKSNFTVKLNKLGA